MKTLVLVLGSALLLSGCCSTTDFPKPGAITLEEAMLSVGAGLRAMERAEEGLITGLLPSEVSVTFNVSASATDSKKLYVEISGGAAPKAGGKAGGETGSTATAARGNQITIKYSNLLFASKDMTLNYKEVKPLEELLVMLYDRQVLRDGTGQPPGVPHGQRKTPKETP